MSRNEQPEHSSVRQETKESKGVIQIAGNYFRGIPGWVLLVLSALLASTVIGSVWYIISYLNRDSSIEVIDVSVIETKEFPIVEFRLRNIGGKVAYIKTAQFEILDHRSISLCASPSLQPVTWTYDVKLSTEGLPPHIQSEKVDQSIPVNGTDRFQFKLSSDDSGISNLYRLKINLIYNTGNDNQVSSEPLIMEIPQDVKILATSHRGGETHLNCVKSNIENSLYMIGLQGIRSGSLAELEQNDLEQNLREVEQALIEIKTEK